MAFSLPRAHMQTPRQILFLPHQQRVAVQIDPERLRGRFPRSRRYPRNPRSGRLDKPRQLQRQPRRPRLAHRLQTRISGWSVSPRPHSSTTKASACRSTSQNTLRAGSSRSVLSKSFRKRVLHCATPKTCSRHLLRHLQQAPLPTLPTHPVPTMGRWKNQGRKTSSCTFATMTGARTCSRCRI